MQKSIPVKKLVLGNFHKSLVTFFYQVIEILKNLKFRQFYDML